MKKVLCILCVWGLLLCYGCGAASPSDGSAGAADTGSTGAAPSSPPVSASSGSPGASPQTPPEAFSGGSPAHGEAPAEESPSVSLLKTLYYDQTLFYDGLGKRETFTAEGDLIAGMVPHHLLASDMIAGFFAMAAEQPPYDGILIVSPSHFPENCGSMVVTARAGWDTPFGKVEPYAPLLDRLLANNVLAAENNPAAVELDHGAAGLVPFVKHYFPDTPLAVVLVQGKLPRERLSALWEVIDAQREEARILVISSADCSHYLMPADAALRDAETIEAIENGQSERIFRFDDDHVDSPQSVNTFLHVAHSGPSRVVRLAHSSSDKKLPHGLDSPIYREGTTTYLVYAAVIPLSSGDSTGSAAGKAE